MLSSHDTNDPRSVTRIAAEVRQLFRAFEANDQDAIDICWFHFENHLVLALTRYLKDDQRWDPNPPQRENSSDGWWIDFLSKSRLVILPPTGLRVMSDALWYNDSNLPDPSPVRFDLELCPDTGTVQWYTFFFGDAKAFGHESAVKSDDPASKEWAFSFQWGHRPASADGMENRSRGIAKRMDATAIFADHGDTFTHCGIWLAALTRQVARADSARDDDATLVSLLYLRHCLRNTLERLLRKDARWKGPRNVDGRARIEGLKGRPIEALTERRFALRDEVILYDYQRDLRFEEPIEFELELDRDGSFLESVIRFARGATGEWEFVFRRRATAK